MANTGLIVVDIQNDYFEGGKWTLHNIDAAADNAARLIQYFRNNEAPVFHVQHIFSSDGMPFFQPGSVGAEIRQGFEPMPGEALFVKNTVNPFVSTALLEALQGRKISEVVICGAMSHMCIDATVRAAADYRYKVSVAEDACAARDLEFKGDVVPAEQVHKAYMSALGFAYARVAATDEILKAGLHRD
jgi:nicotinamidase-related amidase